MNDGLTKRKTPKDRTAQRKTPKESGDYREMEISSDQRKMPKESKDRRKIADGIVRQKFPKGKPKKPGLGRDPFAEEPLSFIRDTSKEPGPERKRGRPKGSGSKGPEQWKRSTFIIRREYLEALKKLAYWERVTATELLDQALETFLKGKRIKKHTKEIKENASKNG